MPAYQFETNITVGNTGESSAKQMDPLRATLSALSANEGGAAPIDLDALTNNGYSSQELVDHLVDGAYNFMYGSANRITSEGDELLFAHLFGLEAPEFASWFYEGTPGIGALVGSAGNDSGEQIVAAQIAAQPTENRGGVAGTHDYSNMIFYPFMAVRGESSGWYREAIDIKKLEDGVYGDKVTPIKIRLADECPVAHDKAFPKCQTPGSIPGVSFLGAVQSGQYTAGEFSSPIVDSSVINGLFPNWPSGEGGVIEAGLKHYYMSTWQTPFRCRGLFINKSWHDALPAQQQAMIRHAAISAHMINMSAQNCNQDAIIKRFQELGATIHRSLPQDVLHKLRQATDEVYVEWSASKGAEYAQMLAHQREFIKANRVGWESANLDRRGRFDGRTNYGANLQVNG